MKRTEFQRSGAVTALLLFLLLAIPACAPDAQRDEAPSGNSGTSRTEETTSGNMEAASEPTSENTTEKTAEETTSERKNNGAVDYAAAEDPDEAAGDSEGFPEYEDFYSENNDAEVQQPDAGGGSVGAIPNVKPFNFGRDPGGPEDKTLYLSVPKIGLEGVPIYNSISEEDLRASAVHVPATGFPWQEGANVYIAGHRIGYPGTGSEKIFYDLDLMLPGDEIVLTDAAGDTYVYRVTYQEVVGIENVQVMSPDADDRSIVTLQSCTLPDYAERLIVQGELVESSV